MHETHESPVIEHSELIDMRTHLTVAMLAASQLNRRTKDLPEATHLQGYLDQSLKSLVEDVVRVDALIAQADACAPATAATPTRHLPRPARWGLDIMRRSIGGFCGWAHRRRLTRITVSYPYL
ncbi:MAG: hypothetical protein ACR2JW_05985 [Thermomicrobiales bacterium]